MSRMSTIAAGAAGGALWLALSLTAPALAEGRIPADQMPGPLKQVGFDQRIGERLPLEAAFVDEAGRPVTLKTCLGGHPAVVLFVYYHCPMLCPLVTEGVAKSLRVLPFDVGRDLEVVAISIDPRETPEQAAVAKRRALERYEKPGSEGGWHFLTGDAASIGAATAAAGFRYTPVEGTTEYAHAGGLLVVTPEGKIAQYLYGVEFAPKDLRLALVTASQGRIGSVIDQVLLYCFRYDPRLGKYTVVTMRVVRLAGVAFLVALTSFLWWMRRREAHHGRETPSGGGALSR